MRRPWLVVPLTLGLAATSASGPTASFQIVVHPSVGGSGIKREVLVAIFYGTVDRWGDGKDVRPVDQTTSSAVRRAFTTTVFARTVGEVQQHWWRQLKERRVLPPPVKASDEEVLVYVASRAGAIGYVSDDAPLPPTVRKVVLLD